MCANPHIYTCEIGGKWDLAVEISAEKSGGPRFASTPPSLWVNWEQSAAHKKVHVTLSHMANIKLHLPLAQMASNLHPKHCSCCRDRKGELSLPAPLHVPGCSPPNPRRWDQNTRDYTTPLLHARCTRGQSVMPTSRRITTDCPGVC